VATEKRKSAAEGNQEAAAGDLGFRLMIAARKSWRPGWVTALGTRPKIFGVEFVKSGGGQAEFPGGGFGGKFIRPMAGQQMADDGCGQAFKKL
jgi:hypothetical protein